MMNELTILFKSLSDPVRLRILNLLLHKQDICVCDLVSALSLPQSVVSRHLAYLRKHQLVRAERRGNWQYYSHQLFGPAAFGAGDAPADAQSVMMTQLKVLLEQDEQCQIDLAQTSLENECC